MAHIKLLCSSLRKPYSPIFQRKLKNPKGWEAQSVLQHRCTLKIATAASHDTLLAFFYLIFVKTQNLLVPSKLLNVKPLRGEAVVALCSLLFLLDMCIMALYGTNKLGKQFNWNCLKQWMIMVFHSECKSWHCQTITHPGFF